MNWRSGRWRKGNRRVACWTTGPHFMWTYVLVGIVVLVAVACSPPLRLWWRGRRRMSQLLSQATDDSLRSKESISRSHSRLDPESRFFIHLSDSEVVCERPDGTFERVGWSDLEKVEIITTGDGPFVTDVFWVLHGGQSGCAVPGGATGEMELLQRLQTLPGFDNEVLIEAMGCTSNKRFVCWQKDRSEAASPKTSEAS